MNVYVETNFVLELVFAQEQWQDCERIVELCATGHATLLLPAYCLAEPHEKLTRQARNRRDLQQRLDTELRQLARTASYRARIDSIHNIVGLLAQSNEEEERRFNAYRQKLAAVATVVPLTLEVIQAAASYEAPYDLAPQDALVYASVIMHLRKYQPTAACFLNRNSKDFDNPDIVDELRQYNCTMIPRFDHGYEFIRRA